jgi:cAMP phosphodiesterase
MKIRVLGASGSEGPGQDPPAFLVDGFLLFDAGTISPALNQDEQYRISHVFLTHAHLDHIKGIPFLVDNFALGNHNGHLTILSGKDVISELRRSIFNDRIWPDFTKIPSVDHAVMEYRILSTRESIQVPGYEVIAVRTNHVVPSYGYILEESESGNCILYTGDTGPTARIWRQMRHRKVKALIVEVSFPDEMQELAIACGHLTPALLAKEMAKMPVLPSQILISHLKPFYRKKIEEQLSGIGGPPLQILDTGMIITI